MEKTCQRDKVCLVEWCLEKHLFPVKTEGNFSRILSKSGLVRRNDLGENGNVYDNSGILHLWKEDFHEAITVDLWHTCQPVPAFDIFCYIELKKLKKCFLVIFLFSVVLLLWKIKTL